MSKALSDELKERHHDMNLNCDSETVPYYFCLRSCLAHTMIIIGPRVFCSFTYIYVYLPINDESFTDNTAIHNLEYTIWG